MNRRDLFSMAFWGLADQRARQVADMTLPVESGLVDARAFQTLQEAVDAAIRVCGTLSFPAGDYLVSNLNLTRIKCVSNSGRFGLRILGAGMGTRLLHNQDSGIMFNLDAGETDLQLSIENLQLVSSSGVGGSDIALNLGALNRYSLLRNVRIYGFQNAIRFNRMTQGLRIEGLCIRGCGRSAISSASTASNIETRMLGGYIDNCGVESYYGGAYWPALDLYQWGASDIRDLVLEGNFASSFRADACEELRFQSDRFEETLPLWATIGSIAEVLPNCKRVSFRDSYGAWPGARFYLINAGADVLFDNCRLDDIDSSGRSPIIGAGKVQIQNSVLNGQVWR